MLRAYRLLLVILSFVVIHGRIEAQAWLQGSCNNGGAPCPMPGMQPQPISMQGNQPPYGAQQPPYGMQQQPGYAPQQPPAPRSHASNDRLPAMPHMMQRPVPTPAVQESRQPIVRGAAPELAANTPPAIPPAAPSWKPIHIPSPSELGIATSAATKPAIAVNNTMAMPEQYDLSTVTTWLDQQGARSCQREKLAEGIQFVCHLGANHPAITVRGNTEKEALQKLVQEVVRQKQTVSLSQR